MLLHVTSLPSPYGIGDVGPAAFGVDRPPSRRGQSWWQALPLGPTGYGNSPYQSLSSFAGNGLLISPDWLIEDGLLRASDCAGRSFPATAVDYDAVIPFKHRLLETAWSNFSAGRAPDLRPAFEQFCHAAGALAGRLRAVPRAEGQVQRRLLSRVAGRAGPARAAALAQARRELASQIDQVRFAQFLLFRQGAAPQGVRARQGRALDRRPAVLRLPGLERRLGQPGAVPAGRAAPAALRRRRASRLLQRRRDSSGAIPSTTGTLFAGPAIAGASTACAPCWLTSTSIRLDHFRAFAAAWHVPAGAPTAQCGPVGARPGRRVLRRRREASFGASAIHRRGPGADHAGRDRPPRPVPPARDARPPVRLRRQLGQPAPAPQLRVPTRSCTPAPTTIPRRAAGSRNCRISRRQNVWSYLRTLREAPRPRSRRR